MIIITNKIIKVLLIVLKDGTNIMSNKFSIFFRWNSTLAALERNSEKHDS